MALFVDRLGPLRSGPARDRRRRRRLRRLRRRDRRRRAGGPGELAARVHGLAADRVPLAGPVGTVSAGVFDVIEVVRALFPFDPALDAMNGALDSCRPQRRPSARAPGRDRAAYGALAAAGAAPLRLVGSVVPSAHTCLFRAGERCARRHPRPGRDLHRHPRRGPRAPGRARLDARGRGRQLPRGARRDGGPGGDRRPPRRRPSRSSSTWAPPT